MRVFQLLPTIAAGDAISHDAVALGRVIRDMGFQTGIYAENVDKRMPSGIAKPIGKLPGLNADDVVLYHLSVGSALNDRLPELPCKKGVIYHNITPSYFFRPYNGDMTRLLDQGRKGVCGLAKAVDFCIADSDYNRQELRDLGYTCEISVCPILIPFTDYAQKPDAALVQRYENDGYVNFLFVGRIAPNKKQEDVIRAFYCYQKHCNPKSRLFLVGSWQGTELYYHRLLKYVQALEVQNVIFTGHISFPQLLAYYHLADLFLCMSEHEGFCVPLVEAMYFDIPIVAYASSAIPYTLGGTGVLLSEKDPMLTAMTADRILSDSTLYREITAQQRRRQMEFSYAKIRVLFEGQLRHFLHLPDGDENPEHYQ